MGRTTTIALLLLLPCLGFGCGDSSHVTDIVTAPLALPETGVLDGKLLIIPQGRAFAFVAQPMGGSETLKERITLDPRDITVVDVFPTQEMNQFVAVGLLAGETDLEVRNEAGVVSEVKLRVEVVAP